MATECPSPPHQRAEADQLVWTDQSDVSVERQVFDRGQAAVRRRTRPPPERGRPVRDARRERLRFRLQMAPSPQAEPDDHQDCSERKPRNLRHISVRSRRVIDTSQSGGLYVCPVALACLGTHHNVFGLPLHGRGGRHPSSPRGDPASPRPKAGLRFTSELGHRAGSGKEAVVARGLMETELRLSAPSTPRSPSPGRCAF